MASIDGASLRVPVLVGNMLDQPLPKRLPINTIRNDASQSRAGVPGVAHNAIHGQGLQAFREMYGMGDTLRDGDYRASNSTRAHGWAMTCMRALSGEMDGVGTAAVEDYDTALHALSDAIKNDSVSSGTMGNYLATGSSTRLVNALSHADVMLERAVDAVGKEAFFKKFTDGYVMPATFGEIAKHYPSFYTAHGELDLPDSDVRAVRDMLSNIYVGGSLDAASTALSDGGGRGICGAMFELAKIPEYVKVDKRSAAPENVPAPPAAPGPGMPQWPNGWPQINIHNNSNGGSLHGGSGGSVTNSGNSGSPSSAVNDSINARLLDIFAAVVKESNKTNAFIRDLVAVTNPGGAQGGASGIRDASANDTTRNHGSAVDSGNGTDDSASLLDDGHRSNSDAASIRADLTRDRLAAWVASNRAADRSGAGGGSGDPNPNVNPNGDRHDENPLLGGGGDTLGFLRGGSRPDHSETSGTSRRSSLSGDSDRHDENPFLGGGGDTLGFPRGGSRPDHSGTSGTSRRSSLSGDSAVGTSGNDRGRMDLNVSDDGMVGRLALRKMQDGKTELNPNRIRLTAEDMQLRDTLRLRELESGSGPAWLTQTLRPTGNAPLWGTDPVDSAGDDVEARTNQEQARIEIDVELNRQRAERERREAEQQARRGDEPGDQWRGLKATAAGALIRNNEPWDKNAAAAMINANVMPQPDAEKGIIWQTRTRDR